KAISVKQLRSLTVKKQNLFPQRRLNKHTVQQPINRLPMAAQFFGYRSHEHPLSSHFPDPRGVNSCPAPLVDAVSLGLRDARALTLPTNVVFKFRHRTQDRERQLACAAAGVDGLVDALERDALATEFIQ